MSMFLLPLSGLYAAGTGIRRLMYSAGVLETYRPGARTVSVGNLTAGGTGKSPLVELLAGELSRTGLSVVVVRRSSARGPFGGDYTDEEKVFAENVPGVQQVGGTSKARSAREAAELSPDIIIVDDGFQTLSLERDLDVVTIDATAPFGNGWLLPAGVLREAPRALKRAGVVVLTHSDEVPDERREAVVRGLRGLTDAEIFEASYSPTAVTRVAGGNPETAQYLRGRKVFAFCGIGNPDGFIATLKGLGCRVTGSRAFRDHHVYSPGDIAEVEAATAHCRDVLTVTTQKDAVRLRGMPAPGGEIYCVEVRLTVKHKEKLVHLVRGTKPNGE